MANENEQLKGSIVKQVFLAGILEIVIAYILIVFELGIMNIINEIISLKNDVLVMVLYISSFIIGLVSTFFIVKILFKKVYKNNVGKIAICMLVAQVLVFIIMTISGYQYVNQTIELLKEEETLESVFYDEYVMQSLLFGYNYDEWKQEYVKMIDEQKDTFNSYCVYTSACHIAGDVMGIVIICVIFKNKSKNVKQLESIQYESIN